MNNPQIIFYEDASLNNRLMHIYFSLAGFVNNWGMPNGFSSYREFVESNIVNHPFFWTSFGADVGRIMSGYGASLYEMGIFGLLVPILFVIAIRNYFIRNHY